MFANAPGTAITPGKVLIADDDPVFRRLLESLLTKWGYTVETVRDGNEAWNRLLGAEAPRLAIVDWMMPGIDGVELCRRIKAEFQFRSVYTILVTGHQQADDCVMALEAGADDFIAKPVNPPELLARVRAGTRVVEYQRFLQTLALEDPLTGLGNRRAFTADLERMAMYSQRHGYGFALMIADVDDFKQINDLFGHDVGDLVLKQVASALQSTFRTEDSSYRLGGDEFGTLFPGITDITAIPIERLTRKLKWQLSEVRVGTPPLDAFTLSIGVACHTVDSPLSAEEIYRYADQSMYAGKCRLSTEQRLKSDG